MSFADKMRFRTDTLSDTVYLEIIAALYGTLVPIVFAGASQAIVGTITARQTGDTVTAVLTALCVVVAVLRAFDVACLPPPVRRKDAARPGGSGRLGVALRRWHLDDGPDPRFVRRAQPHAQ